MRVNNDFGLMTPELHLFHDRRKCRKFLKKNGWKKVKFYSTGAQMFYDNAVATILIEYEGDRMAEYSLLVHECYHAAVSHMEWMGEDDYGEESMAYLIQTISHGVLEAHDAWRRKRRVV
jgi:hypothetical protein